MCLGHVLLEEHSPHGIGNHAVILTDCDEELESKFRDLLESLHFTGFSKDVYKRQTCHCLNFMGLAPFPSPPPIPGRSSGILTYPL